MVLESTIICVDNSEYMRNGDYIPTRLQAQQDAVNTVCHYKLLANPENNVGLMTLANTEVLATLTTDGGKILTSLHKVQPNGYINLLTGIRIAHLSLKHRQGKNHKMRIIVFVGSPVTADEKEVLKIAKRLKKENVNLDIINFGETDLNKNILESIVNTINGREGTGSHLVTIPPSPHLADALLSSPVMQGEDGSGPTNFGSGGGFDFGVDPNEDPELALALRVSMEEQRIRQQEEERRTQDSSTGATNTTTTTTEAASTQVAPATTGTTDSAATPVTSPVAAATAVTEECSNEEQMLQQALAMSLDPNAMDTAEEKTKEPIIPKAAAADASKFPDFSSMTEEEQIAYAMQISLQGCQDDDAKDEPMDVDATKSSKAEKKKEEQPDFSEVMSDPSFLQEMLQSLPGVDPESSVVREAVGSLTNKSKKPTKKDEKKDESK